MSGGWLIVWLTVVAVTIAAAAVALRLMWRAGNAHIDQAVATAFDKRDAHGHVRIVQEFDEQAKRLRNNGGRLS